MACHIRSWSRNHYEVTVVDRHAQVHAAVARARQKAASERRRAAVLSEVM